MTLPALQSVQDATLELVENLPATHAVQVVAPSDVPVSVMLPAAHVVQVPLFMYSPAGHPSDCTQFAVPYSNWQ